MPAEDSVKGGPCRTREDLRLISRSIACAGRPRNDLYYRRRPERLCRHPKRGPVTRLLEDERWLAMLLLLPTLALLGLFIAYPFVEGVRLSVTDTKVGVPGQFVGLQNFEQIWNDRHLSCRGVEHLRLHRRRHGVQAGAGPLAGTAAQPSFQGQSDHSGLHPAAFHHSDGAVDPGLEVDVRPHFQRDQLDAVQARRDPQPDQLARRSEPGADLGDHRQCLARRAVLRDQPARRVADDQPRIARGGGDRRRPSRGSAFGT